jgi:hypothetical protein
VPILPDPDGTPTPLGPLAAASSGTWSLRVATKKTKKKQTKKTNKQKKRQKESTNKELHLSAN